MKSAQVYYYFVFLHPTQAGIVAINVIGEEMSENGEPGTVDPRDVNNVINQYLPPGSTFRDNEGKVVDPAVVGAVNK